jgi:hypothetical protein
VTVAGALLMLPATAFACLAVVFAFSRDLRSQFAGALGPGLAPYGFLLPVSVGLIVAATFGGAGLATIGRWRG